MKIRNEKDVELLEQTIKIELGIDVSKYRNEEVAENFVKLLVFPEYIFRWVLRPIIFAFIAFILGFLIIDLVHLEYLIYGLVGLGLFLLLGLTFGLLFLTWKMKKDMWGIINYSLNIMNDAVIDMNDVGDKMTPGNRKNVLGLLFKGIIHIVTIPMMSQAISENVPLVGRPVKAFVKKVLTLVADKVIFSEEDFQDQMEESKETDNPFELYSKIISGASRGLEKILDITFGVAQFPLALVFGIVLLVWYLFIRIIN